MTAMALGWRAPGQSPRMTPGSRTMMPAVNCQRRESTCVHKMCLQGQ